MSREFARVAAPAAGSEALKGLYRATADWLVMAGDCSIVQDGTPFYGVPDLGPNTMMPARYAKSEHPIEYERRVSYLQLAWLGGAVNTATLPVVPRFGLTAYYAEPYYEVGDAEGDTDLQLSLEPGGVDFIFPNASSPEEYSGMRIEFDPKAQTYSSLLTGAWAPTDAWGEQWATPINVVEHRILQTLVQELSRRAQQGGRLRARRPRR